jgi:hypothetical protein
MLPDDRTQPATPDKPRWSTRFRQWVAQQPLYVKLILLVAAIPGFWIIVLVALGTSVMALAERRPGRAAAFAVATWAIPIAYLSKLPALRYLPLLILAYAIAWASGVRWLSRSYVPCRTTAWVMLWSLLAGISLLHWFQHPPLVGWIAAVLVALALLGYRLARGVQDSRIYGPPRQGAQPGGQIPTAPRNQPDPRTKPTRHQPGQPQYGVQAQAAALPYAKHAARDQTETFSPPRPRPQISVEDAMAELDAMIGLTPVKEQVRSIAASIEAARRRAVAG